MTSSELHALLGKNLAAFAIGVAGASWTYATGDPIDALLGLLLVGESAPSNEAGAFS